MKTFIHKPGHQMWRKLESLKRCQCVEISNLSNGSKDNAYTYLVHSWYISGKFLVVRVVKRGVLALPKSRLFRNISIINRTKFIILKVL